MLICQVCVSLPKSFISISEENRGKTKQNTKAYGTTPHRPRACRSTVTFCHVSTCIPNHYGGRNWGRRGEFCLNLSLNPKRVCLAVSKLMHNKTYTVLMICSITVGIALLLNFTFFFAKMLNSQKPGQKRVKRFWQPLQPVCFLALIYQALHSGTFTDIYCLVLSLCFGSLFCWKVHYSRRTWAPCTRFF